MAQTFKNPQFRNTLSSKSNQRLKKPTQPPPWIQLTACPQKAFSARLKPKLNRHLLSATITQQFGMGGGTSMQITPRLRNKTQKTFNSCVHMSALYLNRRCHLDVFIGIIQHSINMIFLLDDEMLSAIQI